MKFCIDDSCFTCGTSLLEVIRETCCPYLLIVLTFQLAMRSAGNFFLFLCVLLGAVLNSPLDEYLILSFLHAKTVVGQHLTGWGLPSFEGGW